MNTDKKREILLIAFYAFCGALLIAASFCDQALSKALYAPDSFYGEFFRRCGEFPPYLTIPLFGTAFFYGRPAKLNRFLLFVWRLFFAAITLAGFVHMTTKFGDAWFVDDGFRTAFEIVIAVCFAMTALLLGKYIPKHHLKPLKKFAVFGVLAFGISAYGIDGLKALWGRTRPGEMLKTGDFSDFSPWYLPQGNNGNHSFPSGHANQASLLFILTALPDAFASLKKQEVRFFILSWVFSFAVSLSRLIVGAHFLSDVTAAILITFSVVYLLRIVIFKKERKNQL